MAFWGVEIKPGKPYTHRPDEAQCRLRVSQATLGNGKAAGKSVLQCNVGSRSPVLLCSLIPDQSETCQLKLEFEEEGDVVFSVIGSRSVHLSGFFLSSGGLGADYDYNSDSFGEDIGEEDSLDSYDSGDEEENESDFDFIDDDSSVEIFPSSPRPKSSVVIEEILEDDKPRNGDDRDDGSFQPIIKSNTPKLLESEDEDGLPLGSSMKRNDGINNAEKNIEGSSKKVNECRKRKTEINSNHVELAGENSQLHNSSAEISVITRKKKKVQDQNSLESLPKSSSVEATGANENHAPDDKVDLTTERDGKLKKKKKERSTKSETSETEKTIPSSGKSEKVAKANRNEVGYTDCLNHECPSEADKLPDLKKKHKSKNKKSNKNKHIKDENEKDLAGSSAEILAREEAVQQVGEVFGVTDEMPKNSKEDEKIDEDSPMEKLKVSDDGMVKESKNKKSKKHDKNSNRNHKSNLMEKEGKEESQEPRVLANGLMVEKLAKGKLDGKKASYGKKVLVKYIGKLKNGKIFDSTVGKSPFKFVLGRGQVIKGWDIGIEGMQVDEKRRLTIPPLLGYGNKKVGPIPANSWLVFDIELVDVK